MEYYYHTTLKNTNFEEAIATTKKALQKEGFGVLTEIDMKETLKKKLDVDFHNYMILGACNPPFAYQALQAEDKIGTMLPCNLIVQEKEKGRIEIAAVNPAVSMMAIENDSLNKVAQEVGEKLQKVIGSLGQLKMNN
ncbi:DUF302 domain-containing protein [Arenibacter sp. 6A1]|uniref:DUF302 domain-containing protein n=1 Tax=Arenibacter sp. 6A1 TaxID=2720391 RepID=UPI0014457863|nr:DUF302 domain-containing protein [Arenibacter sp. 6A1]NKI25764.1 DUF302 domain-containing protein [Arenibacter sp. 6A1]